MPTVKEISDFFDMKAPYYMKLDFDNVGLLAGFCNADVNKVLTALDITDEVIEEAVEFGAQLIVSHHPLLFNAIKSVRDDNDKGRKLIRLLTSGISAICLHTNLDTAAEGVNDALMTALGCSNAQLLQPHGTHPDGTPYGISRMGELLNETDFFEFLSHTKTVLGSNGLRYHWAGKTVKKLACCGGAGGGDMEKAFLSGCDTYITADLKYDHFLQAKEMGLNLIDADHFCTENVVVPRIAAMLESQYPELDVCISKYHKQVVQFY